MRSHVSATSLHYDSVWSNKCEMIVRNQKMIRVQLNTVMPSHYTDTLLLQHNKKIKFHWLSTFLQFWEMKANEGIS